MNSEDPAARAEQPLFAEAARHHESGQRSDAERLYRQVLAGAPDHAPALHMLGVIARQTGDNGAAVDLISQALRIRPDFAEAYYNRGVCLKDLGRPGEALTDYDAAIRLRPDLVEAHANRAACLKELGRPQEALAACDAALRLRPDFAGAHANRGACLKDLGRLEEALGACDAALRLKPDFAEALSNRAACLKDLDRPEEALAASDAALSLRPDHAEAHANRGASLKDLGRWNEALAACDAALRLAPDFAQAHYNRAACLNDLGRFDDALVAADHAIALRPDLADAHNARGTTLNNLGRLDEALAAHDRALWLDPDSGEAHHNRALVLLRQGDVRAGFTEYRWRWRVGQAARHRPQLQCPEWEGEPLAGKRLLIFGEQGYGDALQFVRYVPLAAAPGAEVTLLVRPALAQLFADSLPGVRVVDALPEGATFDLQVAMMCLPRLFGTTLETIPGVTPYLVADPDRTAHWAAWLGTLPGRKVGLVWAGAPRRHDPRSAALDARRSLEFAQFARLAAASDVQFVSLQLGEPAAQAREAPDGMRLVDWTSELADFADTAALVAGLDLVITVDTAVAHLAGGLGRPVWILSRFDGCWRWLKDRETSPWYPTARLFHQTAPGAWEPVIAAVVSALNEGG